MHPYVKQLQEWIRPHANPDQAAPMARYMRDQFPFLGLKTPSRRALLKEFIGTHGQPPLTDLEQIVRDLWELPEREYQYLALNLLERRRRALTPEHVSLLEHCILTKSWWDTVDALASKHVGGLLARHPEERDPTVERWRGSDNIWLRRTTLLFQLKYKAQTDEALLFELIRENLGSDEFFINKAIGWALREYSKTDAAAVRSFVAETDLAPLSRREALKWLEKQG